MTTRSEKPIKKSRIFSWALYNWGHDPFASVITSFVFAAYFISKVADNSTSGTAQWAWTTAIATIIVAVMSPFLGAIADVRGRRKVPLAFFTLLTIITTALLWFTQPSHHWVYWALIFYGLGLIGFEVAMVYYNAMLKTLIPKRLTGRVSGWGWASGYFGGIVVLIISLFAFIKPEYLSHTLAHNVRIVPVFVAVWMLVFCWPIFFSEKEGEPHQLAPGKNTFTQAFANVGTMFVQLRHYGVVFRFVIARLFYIDGLNTVFTFAGIYAAAVFHFSLAQILYFGIAANIVAGIGTVLIAFIDDWLGPRFVIFWSQIVVLISVAVIYFSTTALMFWIFSMLIALVSGPMQASSRSYLTHISPKKLINQLFGLYSLAGRVTAFIGPLISAIFITALHDVKSIMIVIFVLTLIGLLIFITVPSTKHYRLDFDS